MIYRLHNGSALSKVFGEHVSRVAGIGGCLFFDQELCHGLRSVLIFKSSLTAEIFNQSEFYMFQSHHAVRSWGVHQTMRITSALYIVVYL